MRGERSGVWDCFLGDINGVMKVEGGGSSREEDMGRCTLI